MSARMPARCPSRANIVLRGACVSPRGVVVAGVVFSVGAADEDVEALVGGMSESVLSYESPWALLRGRAADYDAAGDRDMVRRVGALVWLVTAVLAAAMLVVWPPDRGFGQIGWLVAGVLVAVWLGASSFALRRPKLSLVASLATCWAVIAGLGVLQWLAGEPARYSTLIVLPLVFVGASHPPRRVALAAALALLVQLPALAGAQFATTAVAAAVVNVIIWSCLSALALLWTAGVRWQRLALRHSERKAQHLALHDSVTGLGNRRKLTADLDSALSAGRRAMLALFDLNGFKTYNDSFGHPAGDALLARLGTRLAASAGDLVNAYRMGGDEFCLLAQGPTSTSLDLVGLGCDALNEHGKGFRVGAAGGAVAIPGETVQATEALRLADQRMYVDKHKQRGVSARDGAGLVLALLEEHYPLLREHIESVGRLSTAIGRRMGMTAIELRELQQAAELHDIGKLAIPEEILGKPGPLTDREWEFVRRHTLIGERIVAASPELNPIGEIIRSSHERYDGQGYPDALVKREIPLAARIIAVCDAFDAMTSARPYRPSKTRDQAIAELNRCAGTQFDPHVVSGLTHVVAEIDREETMSSVPIGSAER
jgi:diguanylate cyclase (GGDEF)-like protein